jgi:hypothetical protein
MKLWVPALFIATLAVSLSQAANEYALVPIGAVLGIAIIWLAHTLGSLTANPQLEAWSKNEWKDLVVSLITVSLVYGLVSFQLGSILGTTTGYSADKNAFMQSITAKYTQFKSDLLADYEMAIRVAQRIGMVTSYSYNVSGGYIIFMANSNAPFLGATGLRQAINQLGYNMSTGILTYEALIVFMKFFFTLASESILPLGLALRMIPFTKRVGGTIMAISLAGIFFFPYAMALTADLHDAVKVTHAKDSFTYADLDKLTLKLPSFLAFLCTNTFIRFFTNLSEWGWWLILCLPICLTHLLAFYACFAPYVGWCWNGISFPAYNYTQLAMMVTSSIALIAQSKSITNNLGTDPGTMYSIVMDKLVVPVSTAATVPIMEAVLVCGITILAARGLSGILGGEMTLGGIERLV